MEQTKKLTVAFIGNGKSTNRYHLPFVLTRKETFKVKTIYNPRIHHDTWPAIEGVHYTEDINEIWNDPEIDLVAVCTKVDLHYTYTKQVLEHGKHCLCEKPFVMSSAEAKELFALAKEKNLFLSAYQNRRYDSDFLTVQKVIESGKLGDLLEMEMHFDYFRPEVPENSHTYDPMKSYLYGHACHTVDQVISYFGRPDEVRYDVRQLLGPGRMNDYFDLDLYYGGLKVSVKSSYFRIKSRPRFVVYGKKGMFVKELEDRQEEHLKLFYMPGQPGFGTDRPQDYGVLTYVDEAGTYHEEKVVSEQGDYARVYDGIYETLVNGAPQVIRPDQTICQMEILEKGLEGMK